MRAPIKATYEPSCVRFTAYLVYDCARLNNGEWKMVHRDSRGLPMMTNR